MNGGRPLFLCLPWRVSTCQTETERNEIQDHEWDKGSEKVFQAAQSETVVLHYDKLETIVLDEEEVKSLFDRLEPCEDSCIGPIAHGFAIQRLNRRNRLWGLQVERTGSYGPVGVVRVGDGIQRPTPEELERSRRCEGKGVEECHGIHPEKQCRHEEPHVVLFWSREEEKKRWPPAGFDPATCRLEVYHSIQTELRGRPQPHPGLFLSRRR